MKERTLSSPNFPPLVLCDIPWRYATSKSYTLIGNTNSFVGDISCGSLYLRFLCHRSLLGRSDVRSNMCFVNGAVALSLLCHANFSHSVSVLRRVSVGDIGSRVEVLRPNG